MLCCLRAVCLHIVAPVPSGGWSQSFVHHASRCLGERSAEFEFGQRFDRYRAVFTYLMIWKDERVGDDDVLAPSGCEHHHLCDIVRGQRLTSANIMVQLSVFFGAACAGGDSTRRRHQLLLCRRRIVRLRTPGSYQRGFGWQL